MNAIYKENSKGFTLVELLVVVAIIGLLSMMVVISVTGAKAKSRDAQRVSEINSIATVLSMYHNDYNQYPIFDGNITGTDTVSVALRGTGYINMVPTDPLNQDSSACAGAPLNLTGYYYYYQSDGTDFILGYCLETNSMTGKTQGPNYLMP